MQHTSLLALAALLAGTSDAQEHDSMASDEHAHTNRLINETSPYLLQHAHNPVDWYPWGPEAIAVAREKDMPIFLSVGYSACHWCHVMEHESFENEKIAALMNELFVCIKVDREERPDIDEIYMKAVTGMTGSGGWPMSVWLTPDLEPFYGGTYFPPEERWGRPGFPEVLTGLARAWKEDREQVLAQGQKLVEYIDRENQQDTRAELAGNVLKRSLNALRENFDATWGGFGEAPKFPHSMDVRILLRHWQRTQEPSDLAMATTTLDRMAEGGMYDHLAGGFHRYSTDEKWLIPHFEKMLYDNALLVPVYLEAYLATGAEHYATVARECLEWVLTDMVTPEGGFASTIDADSEGEEGKFYVWTPTELAAVLGDKKAAWAAEWWGVTEEGNFEDGASALWRHTPEAEVAAELGVELPELRAAMVEARAALLAARAKRVAPGLDDKVLSAWNGLMASAFCQGYQILGDPRYLDAARKAIDYVLTGMRQEDGRLFATARGGRAQLNAYLDDYAFVGQALLDLYESDFDERWLREAIGFAQLLDERFADPKEGGFFTTGKDHEKLIVRLKNPIDGALPSGNGVHTLNLLRLAELTGKAEYRKKAEVTLHAFGDMINRHPMAFSQQMLAVDMLEVGPREIVIAGEPGSAPVEAMLREVRRTLLPQRVVVLAHAGADEELLPLVKDRSAPEGKAIAFVCRNFTCKLPVDTVEGLRAQLAE